MQMSGSCLQVFSAILQLFGAAVTAAGLLYAWNRASGKFDEWRNDVRARLAERRARIARERAPYEASVNLTVTPSLSVTASVNLAQTGTVEERLHRAENALATLPGQVDKTIEAALDAKLAELDAMRKAFDVQDIYVALAGIAMTALGVLLGIIDLLF